MRLTSIFLPDDSIPSRYTCDGEDVSPPLHWSNAPEDAKAFVLIVDDPDAPGGTFSHWLLYDVPADARALSEGVAKRDTVPGAGMYGVNDFGGVGYGGPCPPSGRPHRYVFALYALDAKLGLASRKRKADVLRGMRDHVLAQAELVGRYERGRPARPARARRPAGPGGALGEP
jgi:Raf kinase inhibitor-like YbhB/YbcL family protein